MSEKPCAFHPDRLTLVSCSRCDRPICTDDMVTAAVGIHCPVCAGRMTDTAVGQAAYRVKTKAEGWPIARVVSGKTLTQAILGANVVVFLLMFAANPSFGQDPRGGVLRRFGALDPGYYPGVPGLPVSQWWRLFTSMFVHLDVLHILFNMFALVMFGGAIEERYGKVRFLGLYLGSGLLGGALSLAVHPVGLRAGASGAIFGILGAWIAYFLRHRHLRDAQGQLRSLFFIVGINLFFGFRTGGIDNFAHIGGLIGGLVIGTGLELASRSRKGTPQSFAGAGAFVAVCVVSIVMLFPHFS